jgi:hypothetical protein
MRTETYYEISRYIARKLMPWAAVIVQVDNGYTGFESMADYQTWRAQG